MQGERSLIEAATSILENEKTPLNLYDLFDRVTAEASYSDEEKEAAVSKFYTDLTISANFVYVGNNEWNLKASEKVELWEKDGSFYKEYTVVEIPEEYKEEAKAKKPKKMTKAAKAKAEKAEAERLAAEAEAARLLAEEAKAEAEKEAARKLAEIEAEKEAKASEVVNPLAGSATSEVVTDDESEENYDEDVFQEYDEFDEDKYNEYMDTYEDQYKD